MFNLEPYIIHISYIIPTVFSMDRYLSKEPQAPYGRARPLAMEG